MRPTPATQPYQTAVALREFLYTDSISVPLEPGTPLPYDLLGMPRRTLAEDLSRSNELRISSRHDRISLIHFILDSLYSRKRGCPASSTVRFMIPTMKVSQVWRPYLPFSTSIPSPDPTFELPFRYACRFILCLELSRNTDPNPNPLPKPTKPKLTPISDQILTCFDVVNFSRGRELQPSTFGRHLPRRASRHQGQSLLISIAILTPTSALTLTLILTLTITQS